MPNHLPPKFFIINKAFVDFVYQKVLVEEWSYTYACSEIRGGIARVRKSFKDWPELEAIYHIYMDRMKSRPKRCNAGYQFDPSNVNYNFAQCRTRSTR